MDTNALRDRLGVFGGDDAERRAVARSAFDLHTSGRYEADTGAPVTIDWVIHHLGDAPSGGPADRWNWWLSSLELAYGGYREFQVTKWPAP
ncbi:hypothetical protein [Natronomonas sp. EA1]|uniref:hypothetical protein n=1 Tax=Natronomonas sp. EA1 TaxID=3421655 RepID=UPI003EB7AE53